MTWISISLFSNKTQWHELIAKGIIPFVNANQQPTGLLQDYTLEFNYSSGDNIRLSLLVSNNNLELLSKKADNYFRSYYAKLNLLSSKKVSKENEENNSVPKNTIQFRLYSPENTLSKEMSAFSSKISQIILEAFKTDDIDDEAIFTFAYYATIGLLKIANEVDSQLINFKKPKIQEFDISEDYINTNSSTDLLKAQRLIIEEKGEILDDFIVERVVMHKKFEEIKNELFEIYHDVINNDSNESTIVWFDKWLTACHIELLQQIKSKKEEFVIEKIFDLICQHLCIKGELKEMLFYFVARVCGLMNPPDVIIMGAEKAGTTTLHFSLITHSNIIEPIRYETKKPTKEVNFFSHPINWYKGMDWYFSHFKGTKGFFLDSSPNYLAFPFCYKLIHDVVPNAKLIICVRNPVDRAYSQYNHYKQILPESLTWDWAPNQDFLNNIKNELSQIDTKIKQDINTLDFEENLSGILLRGVYIKQIKQLLKSYDRSQIYISVTDWWSRNYESELSNIQSFLGVQKESLSIKSVHKREYTVEPFNDEAKQLLTQFYKPFNEELFEFLGYEIPEWTYNKD